MRTGVIAAVIAIAAPSYADPGDAPSGRVEAGVFFGVDYFGTDIGLGDSPAPEQRPQTSAVFGGRLTYIPLKLGGPAHHLDLGAEGEASFAPAWTGYGFDGPRPSVFSPVFGYHANLLIRLGGGWFQPHVTAGGGGETVVSSSKFMAKETDGILMWGVGASFPFERWQLRFDGRQGFTDAMGGGTTRTYSLDATIVARFGVRSHHRIAVETPPIITTTLQPKQPEPSERDTDGDGINDSLDVCPRQPESVNGIADGDGCPEPDTDNDGIIGAADQCPDKAEDLDKFEDQDGCPEDDNDKDGIPDAKDRCPNEAETINGVADTDGCADAIPDTLIKGLAAASSLKFDRGSARLSDAAKEALDRALAPLLKNKQLKVTITVAPEKAGDAEADLAKKRAENVRWYLVDQGVAEGNLTAAVGAPRTDKKAPLLVLSLTP